MSADDRFDPSLVLTAEDVLSTGEGNVGLALLVLLADAQAATHKHRFRRPTPAQRRRHGLSGHVRSYCFICGCKRGHDGTKWWG